MKNKPQKLNIAALDRNGLDSIRIAFTNCVNRGFIEIEPHPKLTDKGMAVLEPIFQAIEWPSHPYTPAHKTDRHVRQILKILLLRDNDVDLKEFIWRFDSNFCPFSPPIRASKFYKLLCEPDARNAVYFTFRNHRLRVETFHCLLALWFFQRGQSLRMINAKEKDQ